MDKIKCQEMGTRIAIIRKSRHITQDQLASQMGLSAKHISHCETGDSLLSFSKMIEFCEICNCSIDYIVWGKSTDEDLEKLPAKVLSILRTGNEKDIDCLLRYLGLYCELVTSEQSQ